MTASQAVDKGQGMVRRSKLERVYNLCLEGGGNILINTSPQPGVMIFTPAATMGYLFLPASGSQQYSALSYPEDIQTQLGLRQDLSYGHARFRVGAVVTLPNGTLIFANVTGDMPQEKARTLLLDQSPDANRLRQYVPHSMTTLNKTQTSGAPVQGNWETVIEVTSEATSLRSLSSDAHGAQVHPSLEKSLTKSDTEQATREPESSSAISTRNPRLQQNRHSDTTFPSYSTAETQPGQGAAQEYRLTSHFTTDTHILILKDGVASWTPIGNARSGANVIQSLPSGNIGDVKGARSAILEQVWFFRKGGDDIDIIQIGMACITANHPILTDDGSILASQAAAKGLGKLPDREYSQLCGLQLATGGNILINISTSQDLPPVYTEAATMGYCFLSPSDPLNGNFPTYALQWTGPRDDYMAQTRPSYSQVTTLHHKGISTRPILSPTLSTPETHASPKVIDDSKKMAKEHMREPRTGIFATVHLGAKTTQRTPEEHSSGLDAARTRSHRTRPKGIQKSCREGVQGDGPENVDEGHETIRRVQDDRDWSTAHAVEVQSHRGIPGPILPRVPTSCLGAGVDQWLIGRPPLQITGLDQVHQSHSQALQ